MSSHKQNFVREAVAAFGSADDLEEAVYALQSAGFDHSQISLLASEATIETTFGDRYERVTSLADDPETPRAAFVERAVVREGKAGLIGALSYIGAVGAAGALVASGGALALAIAGAVTVGGAGAALGTILAERFGTQRANSMNEQIENGGILLWVQVPDEAAEAKALSILQQRSDINVYVHDIEMSDAA
jgi:hypothetical protein